MTALTETGSGFSREPFDHPRQEALTVLIEARKLIEKPENWGQGRRGLNRPAHTCCASEAIESIAEPSAVRNAAYVQLSSAVGGQSIVPWNDAPERTHPEVLAAFDRAIEAERAKVTP